jgi:uncharacterized protein YdaU (DUF1376 family)
MSDPLIHIPLYIDEWMSQISGYDYFKRGAFLTLLIQYVKSNGELCVNGNNTALFRSCGAITEEEQQSLVEIYKDVKKFADPRIDKQKELREIRRVNARKGGLAKAKANGIASAKILAEQKHNKSSANSELESELELERELKEEKDTIVSKKKVAYPEDFEIFWSSYSRPKNKGSKPEALKEWQKLSEPDKVYALQKISAYKESQSNPEYMKHAERYLKSRAWEGVNTEEPKEDDWVYNYETGRREARK